MIHFIARIIRKVFLRPEFHLDPFNKEQKYLGKGKFGLKILNLFTSWEYFIYPIRRYLMAWPFVFYFLGLLAWQAYQGTLFQNPEHTPYYLLSFLILFLFYDSSAQKRLLDVKASQLLEEQPFIDPRVFFFRFRFQLCFGGIDVLSSQGLYEQKNPLNYQTGQKSKKTLLPFLIGLWDTAYIAHFCLSVLRCRSDKALFEFADLAGALWGRRALQLGKCSLMMSGLERLQNEKGRFIFVFNHKSSLDFILVSAVLQLVSINNRKPRPRFLIAKDHFKDNPILYSVLGIGRVSEAVKMIFIHRKKKSKGFANLSAAAQNICHENIDLAIYPQGTRAPGMLDRSGKRRDAGYYTTVNRRDPSSDLSHFKKGLGYMVVDCLKQMKEHDIHDPLCVVVFGIKGFGVAMPKGKFRIQTQTPMSMELGSVLKFSTDVLGEEFAQSEKQNPKTALKELAHEINFMIHKKFVDILDIHNQLKQRFYTELKGQFRFDDKKIELIMESLEILTSDSDLIYMILDRIYCLPSSKWNGYLSELVQLLLERSSKERFTALNNEIVQEF